MVCDRPPSIDGFCAGVVCRARRVLLLALMVASFGVGKDAVAAERPEHEVKAAFLYNFGKYVRWPRNTRSGDEAFVIGVLGTDPFGQALDDVVRGNRIDNKPVVIRRAAKLSELGACEVVFVGVSEEGNLEKVLAALTKAPVLTVGDMPQFVERGGMIGLTMVNRRVHFEVNADAAERAGLALGSQLLRLARNVSDTKAR
jgi:YfiR/HmsC-like